MDYNNIIYILIITLAIIFGIILIIFVYRLDLSPKGDIWFYYLQYKLSNNKTEINEKESLLINYLIEAGHGQLYIYKDAKVYERFCFLQKLLLKDEILYKYDYERRPAQAKDIRHKNYFVYDCFINLTEPTFVNVLNIYELVNYFEQNYREKHNKELDYKNIQVECEFVFIARNKNDLKNSFFYNISTKLNTFNHRQEFISSIRRLLATELFKENGVLNSYSLENLSLANMFYFDNDLSNITQKDVLEALQLTFKHNKII